MSRNIASCYSLKDRERYPFDATLLLFSSTGGESGINDIEALSQCLQGLSGDTAEPLVQSLRPLTPIDLMINRKEIFLQSIEFCGYDMAAELIDLEEKEDENESAESEDEPAKEEESKQKKQAANEIVIGNMLSNSWQPNFFRPTVRIGGVDVAGNISNTNIEQTFHNKSIGLPLPYCLTINKVIKEPKSIEIFCSLAQAYKKTGA